MARHDAIDAGFTQTFTVLDGPIGNRPVAGTVDVWDRVTARVGAL